ncbi:MAG: aminoglycoside phosphotransferase family protein, partial [Acutalibacteraceae bacterium]|nr:aminoglycoside phosphotransferase family protein [Acutalibacteraceae bacterium]
MFQRHLSDYPMKNLHETIKDFHNTPKRLEALRNSVEADVKGRAASVEAEIKFAFDRTEDAKYVLDLHKKGLIPLRVTHNDTKLNNILFDRDSNDGICIIDLDTVMPGLSLYDFGDSIRFGANTAAEDEKDVSKVSLSLPLYEAYTKGYLSSAKDSLTETETEYMAFSSKLMTYECGIRFLGDYLNGDVYFKTDYPEHNLVRAKTQFALVADMEKKMDEMRRITENALK